MLGRTFIVGIQKRRTTRTESHCHPSVTHPYFLWITAFKLKRGSKRVRMIIPDNMRDRGFDQINRHHRRDPIHKGTGQTFIDEINQRGRKLRQKRAVRDTACYQIPQYCVVTDIQDFQIGKLFFKTTAVSDKNDPRKRIIGMAQPPG